MAVFLVEIDKMLTTILEGKEHYWKRTGDEVIVQWCETEEIMMAIKIWEKKYLMAIFATFSHNVPKDMFPLFIHIVNTYNSRLSPLKVTFGDKERKYYDEFGKTDIWVISYMHIADYDKISILRDISEVSCTSIDLKEDLDKWMSVSGSDFSLPEKSNDSNCS